MTRALWTDIPLAVRAQIEEALGGPVVEAVSQPGGYSPGSADPANRPRHVTNTTRMDS